LVQPPSAALITAIARAHRNSRRGNAPPQCRYGRLYHVTDAASGGSSSDRFATASMRKPITVAGAVTPWAASGAAALSNGGCGRRNLYGRWRGLGRRGGFGLFDELGEHAFVSPATRHGNLSALPRR